MLAIHNQLTRQLHHRLRTTNMALGLVRLLQDAGRTEEARTIRFWLETGWRCNANALDNPNLKSRKTNRMKCISTNSSFVVLRARHDVAPITN